MFSNSGSSPVTGPPCLAGRVGRSRSTCTGGSGRSAQDRAVVVVAQRERLGEGPVERDVLLAKYPIVCAGPWPRRSRRPLPAVPRPVLARPVMVQIRRCLRAGERGVVVERQQVAVGVARVGLVEDGPPAGELDRGRVGESADPRHRARNSGRSCGSPASGSRCAGCRAARFAAGRQASRSAPCAGPAEAPRPRARCRWPLLPRPAHGAGKPPTAAERGLRSPGLVWQGRSSRAAVVTECALPGYGDGAGYSRTDTGVSSWRPGLRRPGPAAWTGA